MRVLVVFLVWWQLLPRRLLWLIQMETTILVMRPVSPTQLEQTVPRGWSVVNIRPKGTVPLPTLNSGNSIYTCKIL